MPFLIENGSVIDGTGAEPRREAVAFADSIVATGAAALHWAADRNDVERIDAAGMTVMPGLIDAHCHITFDEPFSTDELFFHRREGLSAIIAAYNARKVLRSGCTGILDADCVFSVSVDLRDAIEAGITEGPRMAVGGNALFTSVGGTAGPLIPDEGRLGYSKVTRTRDEIVTEVRRQIKGGVDWIKVHVTGLIPRQRDVGEIQVWSMDELKAAVDTAHALGIPVVGHCRNASSTRDAARAGFDMILHGTFMDEEALEAVVEAKVPIVPTLTFQQLLADHGHKIGSNPTFQKIFEKEIAGSSAMLSRAWREGVPMLAGSESGFSITPYGEWHWLELQVFVEHFGMSPLEAISCATREGARALRKEGQVGTIEQGMAADVIVVDGDVSRDVTLLGQSDRLKHVFLGGRRVDIETPLPERGSIPNWRIGQYSTRPLTRDVAGEA
ncbi:MAG: amidohydrolase family protein [Alphaproteobacteria bacterium]|nr:amidohydrolase family protein [Alphaproteobacteria bacterium]